MAKYHINNEGNPGACRARSKPCPFGGDRDHYSSAEEARKVFEDQQELLATVNIGGGPALSPASEIALSVPLESLDEQPQWIWGLTSRLQQELFGVTPQAIAKVDSSLGPLAVVWESSTADLGDVYSQVDDGYRVSRITYRSMETGEIIAYVKTAHMTEESLRQSYGDDDWRGFRYLRKEESFYALDMDYAERESDSLDQSAEDFGRHRVILPELEDREKLVDFLEKSQSHLRSYSDKLPRSMDTEELQEELTRVKAEASARLDAHGKNYSEPYIDYINLDRPELRGQGLGASLYIFMARKQAEQGLPIRASSLQTPEAEKSWKRMAADPKLPVRVENNVYTGRRGERKVSAQYFLDFREESKRAS